MNRKLKGDILKVLGLAMEWARRDPRTCTDFPLAGGVTHVTISAEKLRRLLNRMGRFPWATKWQYDPTYMQMRDLAQLHAQKVQAEQGNTRECYAELACFHACSAIHSLFGAVNENRPSLADAVGSCGLVYLYSSLAEGKYADEVSAMTKARSFQMKLFDSLQWEGPFEFP